MFERIHISRRRPTEIPLGAIAMAFMLFLPLGAWFVESGAYRPGLCSLKAAIGYPCLTCGATRATLHLFHGNIFKAIAHQPMMMLIYTFVFGWGLVSLWAFATRKSVRVYLTPRWETAAKVALIGIPTMNWLYLVWAGI